MIGILFSYFASCLAVVRSQMVPNMANLLPEYSECNPYFSCTATNHPSGRRAPPPPAGTPLCRRCSGRTSADGAESSEFRENSLQTLYFKNRSLELPLSDLPAGKPEYVQTYLAGHFLFNFEAQNLSNSGKAIGIVWKFACGKSLG